MWKGLRKSAFSKRGYTLLETILTVGILLLLSSMLVVYNQGNKQQLAVISEQAKIINTIYRAKFLAMQGYESGQPICGYGVYFKSDGTYILYKDLGDCSVSDKKYTNQEENLKEEKLDKRLVFVLNGLNGVLFMPPEPRTVLDVVGDESVVCKDGCVFEIKTPDGKLQKSIQINKFGQISAQ